MTRYKPKKFPACEKRFRKNLRVPFPDERRSLKALGDKMEQVLAHALAEKMGKDQEQE